MNYMQSNIDSSNLMIIVTRCDFFLNLLLVPGGYVSDEAYAVSAIILLPINPAFNPFLYSHLPDLIWEALLPVRKRFASTKCGKWCHESMGKAMSMRSRRERSRATT